MHTCTGACSPGVVKYFFDALLELCDIYNIYVLTTAILKSKVSYHLFKQIYMYYGQIKSN